MGLTILCGDDMPVATFELTLSPLLYYSFLSPQQLRNVEEIIEILWGYTAKDSMDVLELFFPDRKTT